MHPVRTPPPRRRGRIGLSAALVALALLVGTASAYARPGGGGSFSGGSHSGGGSGGGGSIGGILNLIQIIVWLVELHFEHPLVALFIDLVIAVIVLVVWFGHRSQKKAAKGWTTAAPVTTASPSRAVREKLLAGLIGQDPDFSLVLFEDFLYALYANVQEARGRGKVPDLAPYLRPPALASLQRAPGLVEARTVVIGSLRYVSAAITPQGARVTVEIESNYTEVYQTATGSAEQTFYVKEQWYLGRAPGVRSRPPERARIIGCPNCGGPLSAIRGNTCTYCQARVETGAFDWTVDVIQELEKEPRGPQLTGNVEEEGTNLPTVADPAARDRFAALMQRDPALNWDRFAARLGVIFAEFQVAWSKRDLASMRPYLSDSLFQMQIYWVETYKRARLTNMNEQTRIGRLELATVISDRYFDAITVRVFATGLDYTVADDTGRVVSGSKTKPRAYTEYWTLIRGAQTRSADRSPKACPNCGAPLSVNMSGSCAYCKAKVTSGEFDWVLSRIEQDETYG